MIVFASETRKGVTALSKNIRKCPHCDKDGIDAASVVANTIEAHGLLTCTATIEGVLSEAHDRRRTFMSVATCTCGQDVSITFCPNGEIYTEKIDLGD